MGEPGLRRRGGPGRPQRLLLETGARGNDMFDATKLLGTMLEHRSAPSAGNRLGNALGPGGSGGRGGNPLEQIMAQFGGGRSSSGGGGGLGSLLGSLGGSSGGSGGLGGLLGALTGAGGSGTGR